MAWELNCGRYLHGFWGLSKSENGGGFPLTHHLGGDFDHGKIMKPVNTCLFRVNGTLPSHHELVHEW